MFFPKSCPELTVPGKPESECWTLFWDDVKQRPYYHNSLSKRSFWSKPGIPIGWSTIIPPGESSGEMFYHIARNLGQFDHPGSNEDEKDTLLVPDKDEKKDEVLDILQNLFDENKHKFTTSKNTSSATENYAARGVHSGSSDRGGSGGRGGGDSTDNSDMDVSDDEPNQPSPKTAASLPPPSLAFHYDLFHSDSVDSGSSGSVYSGTDSGGGGGFHDRGGGGVSLIKQQAYNRGGNNDRGGGVGRSGGGGGNDTRSHCRNFAKDGSCRFGARCHFRHAEVRGTFGGGGGNGGFYRRSNGVYSSSSSSSSSSSDFRHNTTGSSRDVMSRSVNRRQHHYQQHSEQRATFRSHFNRHRSHRPRSRSRSRSIDRGYRR